MTRYFSKQVRLLVAAVVLAGFVFGELRAMTERPILMDEAGTSSDQDQLTARDDGIHVSTLWLGTFDNELTMPFRQTEKLPNKITGKLDSSSFAESAGGHGVAFFSCAHSFPSNRHSLVTQHIRLQV